MVNLDKNNNILNNELLKKLGYVKKDYLLMKNNVEITNLEIPANYVYEGKTYDIKKIDDKIFSNIKNLNSVIIPNTVTEIGKNAFFKITDFHLGYLYPR